MTISAGLGYTSPIWAGAAITAVGLAVMLFAAGAARRSANEATMSRQPLDAHSA